MNREALLSRLLILTVIGGLLPLGASYWWVSELFSHFRVQYIVLASVLATTAFIFKKRLLALLLVGTVGLNGEPVLPYLWAEQTPPDGLVFSMLNINVNSRNDNYTAIVDAIRSADADLVAIVELTPALDQALIALANQYPYRFTLPSTDSYGIGMLSRNPLVATRAFGLLERAAIDVSVELPSGGLRFFAVHLSAPPGPNQARLRNKELDDLAALANRVDEPLLICGDFNLTPYSPFFDRFAQAGRLRAARVGQGIGISWPTFLPLVGIPIDHCFVRGPIAVNTMERLDRMGSDHYPVKVEFAWQADQ